MKIIRTKDYRDMSRKAANIISAQMILKDDSVLPRNWQKKISKQSSPIFIRYTK